MYELIICEKSQAARLIAESLADNKPIKKQVHNVPYYELTHNGKQTILASAVGHLFILAEKEKSKWTYPIFDIEWKPSYLVNKGAAFTKRYYDTLKDLTKKASSFTIATDYDTEGELIGFNVLKFICNNTNARRMKFSTLTKQEIIESYNNASPHIDFNLVEAGETRHYLDHMWGINSSRALTLAIKEAKGGFKILSSGRVQSPILALLEQREKEIGIFKPVPYWQIFALISAKEDLLTIHKKDKFWDEKEAKLVHEKCKNKDARIVKITRRQYQSLQPLPFNITSLQTESYRLFKFSPQQTLDIAESLYLNAYISYPRTSSEKLDPRIGYRDIIQKLSKLNEVKKQTEILLKKEKLYPRQGKKEDIAHIAIYPTSVVPDINKLDDKQKKLYLLVVKRFLATFADPALRETMEIDFEIDKEIFYIKGSRTISEGWISFYEPYVKLEEITLPELKENEIYKVKKLEIKKDQTKPPQRYTQGSIIAQMEKINLGTRATRSIILQTLYDRGYIKGKTIEVTTLGKHLVEVLKKYVPELVSENLTRHFEKEMDEILESKKKKEQVIKEARTVLTKILTNFKKNELQIGKELAKAHTESRNEESILGPCKKCNKGHLRILFSKKTQKKFVACSNYPQCKNTYSLPQQAKIVPTDKLCKECGVPIIKVVRKGKRPFEMCLTSDCVTKASWGKNKTTK